MDLFDDIFSEAYVENAPVVKKFQPKAKPRPRKAAFKSGPTICSDSKKKVMAQESNDMNAGKSVQLVDVADKMPESPVVPSSALEDTLTNEKALEKDKHTSLGSLLMDEDKNSQPMNSLSQHGNPCLGAEVPVFDENGSLNVPYADAMLSQVEMAEGDFHPFSEELVVEGSDVCSELELESLDDVINLSTSGAAADGLHGNTGMNDHPRSKSSSPVNDDDKGCSFPPLETRAFNVPGTTDARRASHGHISDAQASAADCMAQDHVVYTGATVSNQNRESEFEIQKSQTELSEIGVADFEIVDTMPRATALPGSRVGKYQPRLKMQNRKPKVNTGVRGGETMSPPAAQLGTQGSGQIDDGSGRANQPDGDSLPGDYSCDQYLDAELANSKETSPSQVPFSDDVLHSPAVPEKVNAKGRKKSSKVLDHSQGPTESSLPGKGNNGVKMRRQQKKNVAAASPDCGPEERTCYSGVSHDETTANSTGSEDENRKDNVEEKGESKSKKKRAPRKGKKLETSENPGQKRDRSSTAPKKFPHGTQRKRRCVDKNLLDIPEDEIDYRNLRIKDLIILAEVRERLASKASKSNAPPTNQSVDNDEHDEFLSNENGISSEQEGDFADDQDTIRAEPNPLFNYHSFMARPRSARWTKQETELFYEGVRQFGSDLSLIKQLFPNRDRNQVKNKFKLEERKNRLRLHETLASRPKDYTYFKKVIEQLQQASGYVEQDANDALSMGKSDADAEELIPEANVEPAKDKQDEDTAVDDDILNAKSPVELEEADDNVEDDIWSSYQSMY